MRDYQIFELRRLSDDLIYTFDRISNDGDIEYKRRDLDVRIIYKGAKIGWVAYDKETETVTGRPWDIHPDDQDCNCPPTGEWVSKKGVKSYVYDLQYVQEKQ